MANQPAQHAVKPGTRIAELLLLSGSIVLSLLGFLAVDLIYSKQQLADPFTPAPPKNNGRSLYISKPSGWYELNANYSGQDRYGRFLIDVKTDAQGFRVPINTSSAHPKDRQISKPTLVFFGDSFTYGVGSSWEQSFVGQVAKRYAGNVINAGVVSHSPTPHHYRINRLLRHGTLPPGAIVVMAIDISDVQDEASRWVPGNAEPIERQSSAAAAVVRRQGAAAAATKINRQTAEPFFSPRNFQLTHRIYYSLEGLVKRFLDHWQARNLERSAFTHRPWSQLDRSYQPLGVAGGLKQLRQQVQQAARLSASHGHPFWILIYPWPAQLAYDERFSWERFIKDSCEPKVCSGVINTFPAFRRNVGADRSAAKWQNHLYLHGDVHFTPAGNAVIAESVLQALR